MKSEELRRKSEKELRKLLNDLEYEQIKASSIWGREIANETKAGTYSKGGAKQGQKTSIQKDLRRMKARILTILKEKELKNDTTN